MAGRSRDPKVVKLRDLGVLNPHPERVDDPLFADHPFFDARDLVQVKYEMLRAARVDAQPVRVVAARFGLSHVTYYQLKAAFGESGIAGLLPKKRGPRGGHKLTSAVLSFLDDHIAEADAVPPAAELASLLREQLSVVVHPRSIERALARRGEKKRR
jgi:transposase